MLKSVSPRITWYQQQDGALTVVAVALAGAAADATPGAITSRARTTTRTTLSKIRYFVMPIPPYHARARRIRNQDPNPGSAENGATVAQLQKSTSWPKIRESCLHS